MSTDESKIHFSKFNKTRNFHLFVSLSGQNAHRRERGATDVCRNTCGDKTADRLPLKNETRKKNERVRRAKPTFSTESGRDTQFKVLSMSWQSPIRRPLIKCRLSKWKFNSKSRQKIFCVRDANSHAARENVSNVSIGCSPSTARPTNPAIISPFYWTRRGEFIARLHKMCDTSKFVAFGFLCFVRLRPIGRARAWRLTKRVAQKG